MNEARLRIRTLNTDQTIFSPQDIVECSEYSQGCDGGFPVIFSLINMIRLFLLKIIT